MTLLRSTPRLSSGLPPEPFRGPWNSWPAAGLVFLFCVVSRLATTIRHIEDADSLRFALAMRDFDVAKLQPQFPGYPVFVFAARLLQEATGSYALAFSALGGAGLFVLVHAALSLLRWRASEPRGIILILLFFFNPMLWLLGNRYMSDLSGAALLYASFLFLASDAPGGRRRFIAGCFLAGLQAGWRLSYWPFLAVPLAAGLLRRGGRTERFLALAAGVLVWLVPFVAVSGWDNLLAAARPQTAAHFAATGGTYVTESDWSLRLLRPLGHLWTDGLGAWWPDRHPVTLVVGAGAAILLAFGVFRMLREGPGTRLRLLFLASAVYAAWILLFQNVVHQTRHVLPLVPPLLMLLAKGAEEVASAAGRGRRFRLPAAGLLLAFLGAYAFVGVTLARQHMRPAAIAQVLGHLKQEPPAPEAIVVTAPWVQKCLTAQGFRAEFLAVETPGELEALARLDPSRPVVTVGDYSDRIGRPVRERRTYYHNPYVNRLGARIEVFRYDAEAGAP